MPIFFAFYQVLYESVELLGAPFFGWITDLKSERPTVCVTGFNVPIYIFTAKVSTINYSRSNSEEDNDVHAFFLWVYND